jgi:hypothetical protein
MQPQAGFDSAAEKRQAFIKKQKVFKKAWRSLLSDLEFASGDAEALAAIKGLVQLIVQNGLEIPEGVRKQDLDQVYLVAKPRLQKETRLEFKKLDALVLQIVTVKNSDVGPRTPRRSSTRRARSAHARARRLPPAWPLYSPAEVAVRPRRASPSRRRGREPVVGARFFSADIALARRDTSCASDESVAHARDTVHTAADCTQPWQAQDCTCARPSAR